MDRMDDEPYLSDEDLEESEEERRGRTEAVRKSGTKHLRSSADDILDAIDGSPARPPRRTDCPLCSSPTKMRGPGVGAGVIVRRCTNPSCRNEFPVGMARERAEIPPLPPDPGLLGPYTGEGGPPIDRNQPIHRRLAEHIRRIRDREP